MPEAHFEVPIGAIDSVNRVFTVSMPYTPGSVAVFVNGQLKRADYDDGWVETDPSSGEVTLDEAPRGGVSIKEVVQIFYLDTTDAPNTEVIEGITGKIDDISDIYGIIDEYSLNGVIDHEVVIEGIVVDEDGLIGRIDYIDELVGVITCR